VGNTPINLPKMRGVKLSLILSRILAQVEGAYLVRPDGIEVTTAKHATPGQWSSFPSNEVPSVATVFEAKPLEEALRELSDATGISILVDPRGGEKVKAPLTANLKNVPLDTAVNLLADMAGLKVVTVDNVLYVTTVENAKGWEARPTRPAGQSPPAM
jgi:type II secretory pathway component GspD/PulD (secretin)